MSKLAPSLCALGCALAGFASPAALAGAHLLVSADTNVHVFVDEQPVGSLGQGQRAPVLLAEGGTHSIEIQTTEGTSLHTDSLSISEGKVYCAHWNGSYLRVAECEVAESTLPTDPDARSSGPSTMSTVRAGTTAAGLVFPGSTTVSAVQTSTSAISATGTLARAVDQARRDLAPAPSSSVSRVNESHDLESLHDDALDPYLAAGGASAFDATVANVTFVVPPGTLAIVTIAHQPVATFSGDSTQQLVKVVPGMHKVVIQDASGTQILHRGYLTATAGHVFELHFSATEPPTTTLPGTWR